MKAVSYTHLLADGEIGKGRIFQVGQDGPKNIGKLHRPIRFVQRFQLGEGNGRRVHSAAGQAGQVVFLPNIQPESRGNDRIPRMIIGVFPHVNILAFRPAVNEKRAVKEHEFV